MMYDYRLQLKEYDRRGIAPFGEGCALFAALSSFVFVFCIGFDSSAYGSFDLYSAFSLKSAGAGFGIAAALIAILSVSALFALTVLRYIRFLTGKSQKDSVYFCYATVFCYLAGIMLFSECAAQGTYRLNGATQATPKTSVATAWPWSKAKNTAESRPDALRTADTGGYYGRSTGF